MGSGVPVSLNTAIRISMKIPSEMKYQKFLKMKFISSFLYVCDVCEQSANPVDDEINGVVAEVFENFNCDESICQKDSNDKCQCNNHCDVGAVCFVDLHYSPFVVVCTLTSRVASFSNT